MTERTPGTLPEPEVQAMFDRIAGFYRPPQLGDDGGAGHHQWRARAAELAALGPGGRALDVATGTGDLEVALGHRVAPGGSVVGVDFSESMLALARAKAEAAGAADQLTGRGGDLVRTGQRGCSWRSMTASSTPRRSGSAPRNFSDLRQGLSGGAGPCRATRRPSRRA